jgi:hypothetical protein
MALVSPLGSDQELLLDSKRALSLKDSEYGVTRRLVGDLTEIGPCFHNTLPVVDAIQEIPCISHNIKFVVLE